MCILSQSHDHQLFGISADLDRAKGFNFTVMKRPKYLHPNAQHRTGATASGRTDVCISSPKRRGSGQVGRLAVSHLDPSGLGHGGEVGKGFGGRRFVPHLQVII